MAGSAEGRIPTSRSPASQAVSRPPLARRRRTTLSTHRRQQERHAMRIRRLVLAAAFAPLFHALPGPRTGRRAGGEPPPVRPRIRDDHGSRLRPALACTAIDGMLAGLDPHSTYSPSRTTRRARRHRDREGWCSPPPSTSRRADVRSRRLPSSGLRRARVVPRTRRRGPPRIQAAALDRAGGCDRVAAALALARVRTAARRTEPPSTTGDQLQQALDLLGSP